jgi:aminobenzoyl-glutamate transport protein
MQPTPQAPAKKSILDWIEWAGNKLPEPALIFVILAAVVIAVAGVGDAMGWKVQPVQPRPVMVDKIDPATGAPKLDQAGNPIKIAKRDENGKVQVEIVEVGTPIEPRSLLTRDGFYWMMSSMLRNFTALPALGLIFVAMLGIGLAEKFGFFSALMRALAFVTPKKILTPVIVLIGANSSVASDAGYIILPPLAAALYFAVGRHPVAGLAAAFAGVAGGFGGGFFPTGGDGALTGFAQDAARVIDAQYQVTILHNIYFKMGSAIVVMLAGWLVTDFIVEPRLMKQRAAELPAEGAADTSAMTEMALTRQEKSGLIWSLLAGASVLATFAALILVPGAPLHGAGAPTLANDRVVAHQPVTITTTDKLAEVPKDRVLYQPASKPGAAPAASTPTATATTDATKPPAPPPDLAVVASGKPSLPESPGDRWSHVIVPIIFLTFLIPGMVFGFCTGAMRSQKDFIDGIYHGVKSLVPVLTIAFFMGQFVNYFAYTRLDRMLAYEGGVLLVQMDLPTPLLLALFVLVVVLGDFCLSGMLSKFGVMAPIFIPMFMMVGISPELMTAAYRIGDSVVNIITPLNSYLLIILVVLQKYKRNAGLGSLISLMLPYSVVFFIVWTSFLMLWWSLGLPLGPDAPLTYTPAS